MRGILNKHDPIKIYYFTKAFDEYDPEIKTIYKRSKAVNNLDNFTTLVHKVFIRWFGKDITGKKKKYVKLSKELFELLKTK